MEKGNLRLLCYYTVVTLICWPAGVTNNSVSALRVANQNEFLIVLFVRSMGSMVQRITPLDHKHYAA